MSEYELRFPRPTRRRMSLRVMKRRRSRFLRWNRQQERFQRAAAAVAARTLDDLRAIVIRRNALAD